jgi:hypothetical protein
MTYGDRVRPRGVANIEQAMKPDGRYMARSARYLATFANMATLMGPWARSSA